LEDQAQALDAIVDQARRSDPVFSSYGSRPLTDRAAIAKALAGTAANALQRSTSQHRGQWSGLSLCIAPTTASRACLMASVLNRQRRMHEVVRPSAATGSVSRVRRGWCAARRGLDKRDRYQ
jgi:hypothetical protein